MNDYPSLPFTLLQGLLSGVILMVPPLVWVFSSRLRVGGGDIVLALMTLPMATVVTALVFWPFEGAWADYAFGPFVALRSLLVGGLVLTIGMAITQRKALSRRPASEVVMRLAAAFLMGAVWGAVWGFAGWCLQQLGVSSYG